tara:strand:+ start:603 stop:986 length:384 start_codon:yes stop_codon:yes gene_type:complete
MKKKLKKLDRKLIRSLLIAQKGRCAISGQKLKPADVALDHILPISRTEFKNKKGYADGWLVTKKVNALKNTLTIDELYELIDKINKNRKNTKIILDKIINKKLKPIEKEDFDDYIKNNYSDDGQIKK